MAYFTRETSDVIPYSVGNRIYSGGMPQPTMGPVDPTGYAERDLQAQARRDAVLRRLKAQQSGNFMSADSLRTV